MTDAEIERIAKGLTKAQRDWLARPQDRLHTDGTFAAMELDDTGLAKPMYCPTAQDFGHIATAKGLRVRAYLKEQTDA